MKNLIIAFLLVCALTIHSKILYANEAVDASDVTDEIIVTSSYIDTNLSDLDDPIHVIEGNDTVFYEYTDSSAYYYYNDSTEAPAEEFFRHSIRPKIKFKLFNDNLVFDYRFFYKPRVGDLEDYLLEHELKISIATFYEALTIDLNYTNKYNSRYDGEQKFINPETLLPYKARDENISVGLSFMF